LIDPTLPAMKNMLFGGCRLTRRGKVPKPVRKSYYTLKNGLALEQKSRCLIEKNNVALRLKVGLNFKF
jgi:hypothetical protein